MYKPPKNIKNDANIFFGGSNLDLNQKDYQSFIKQISDEKDEALVVPICPGFHGFGSNTSEDKIKESTKEICKAIKNNSTKFYNPEKRDKNISVYIGGNVNCIGPLLRLMLQKGFKKNSVT